MNEPWTNAGRELCTDLEDWEGWDPTIVAQVLAIEAEAAAPSLTVERLALATMVAFHEHQWSVHPYGTAVPMAWETVAAAILAALGPEPRP